MSQTNADAAAAAAKKQGNYDAWNVNPWPVSEQAKGEPVSQVQALLDEGGVLFNELSQEIGRTCRQFEPVMLPEPLVGETGFGEPLPPQPIRSEIGQIIHCRNETLRWLIADLRSINNRSTVAP